LGTGTRGSEKKEDGCQFGFEFHGNTLNSGYDVSTGKNVTLETG
jgi:hypothetical protein